MLTASVAFRSACKRRDEQDKWANENRLSRLRRNPAATAGSSSGWGSKTLRLALARDDACFHRRNRLIEQVRATWPTERPPAARAYLLIISGPTRPIVWPKMIQNMAKVRRPCMTLTSAAAAAAPAVEWLRVGDVKFASCADKCLPLCGCGGGSCADSRPIARKLPLKEKQTSSALKALPEPLVAAVGAAATLVAGPHNLRPAGRARVASEACWLALHFCRLKQCVALATTYLPCFWR